MSRSFLLTAITALSLAPAASAATLSTPGMSSGSPPLKPLEKSYLLIKHPSGPFVGTCEGLTQEKIKPLTPHPQNLTREERAKVESTYLTILNSHIKNCLITSYVLLNDPNNGNRECVMGHSWQKAAMGQTLDMPASMSGGGAVTQKNWYLFCAMGKLSPAGNTGLPPIPRFQSPLEKACYVAGILEGVEGIAGPRLKECVSKVLALYAPNTAMEMPIPIDGLPPMK